MGVGALIKNCVNAVDVRLFGAGTHPLHHHNWSRKEVGEHMQAPTLQCPHVQGWASSVHAGSNATSA